MPVASKASVPLNDAAVFVVPPVWVVPGVRPVALQPLPVTV